MLEFLPGFSCQQTQDELAFFLVLSVCVIDFLCHVERMTDENKRDHNAASLFEFGGAMTDENKRDHNAASLFEFGGAMNDWCDPRDGPALCHLSGQDTSRGVPSEGRHRSKVCACRR